MDAKNVNNGIDGIKSKFNGLKEIAIGAFRQIGASAVSALGNGLKGWASDASDTQKAMNALQATMKFKGNADEFDFVSKSMSKLAKDTNANTEDTIKLSTTFVGLGDDAKSAVSKTEALVKANQKFGGTGENLKGVVQAYGQMSAAGKVTAENINQLTDNNTALGSALKSTVMEMNPALKQYGSFATASEKGAISVEMLDKAMQEMATKGGGSVQTISDAWDSFNETMSLALLPALDALTPVISALVDKMAEWGESAGKAMEKAIKWVKQLWTELEVSGTLKEFGKAWDNIKGIFGGVIDIIKKVLDGFGLFDSMPTSGADAIGDTMEVAWEFADGLEDITGKISDFIKKISESETAIKVMSGALVMLTAGFVAFKIGKAIEGAVTTFKLLSSAIKATNVVLAIQNALLAINPYVAIGVAIATVVAGLVYFFTKTKTGQKIWKAFVDFLKSSIEAITKFFKGLGDFFSELWTNAVKGAQDTWNGLVEWFSGLVQGIQDAWNGMTDFFSNLWIGITTGISDAWNGVLEFFSNLWTAISTNVTDTWNSITEFLGGVVQSIMDFFQPLIDFYQSLWDLILSIINLVIALIMAGIRGLVKGIEWLWNGLVDIVQAVWDKILDIINVIVEAIKTALKATGDFINSVWQAIYDFFHPIMQSIGDFAGQIFKAIGDFAKQAWDFISGVWGGVADWFGGIFDSVKTFVSNAFNAFGKFASSAWDSVTGVFSDVGAWFGGVFDSAKQAVDNALGALGDIAQNAWNAITDVFGNVYQFFADAFGGVKDLIDSILGGISGTLDKISGAINGVTKTVNGMFKGSSVTAINSLDLQGSKGSGMTQNSVSADNRSYNTFTINAGNQDATALARAVRREFDTGRA